MCSPHLFTSDVILGTVSRGGHDNKNLSCFFNLFLRIYHECEGRIEKSVPKITIWHPILTRLMDYFSCSPPFLFIYLFILKLASRSP